MVLLFGAVAQLVERVVRNDEAVSSNLIGSTSRALEGLRSEFADGGFDWINFRQRFDIGGDA